MKYFLTISAFLLNLSGYAQIQVPAITAVDTSAEIPSSGLLFEEHEGFSMVTRKKNYGVWYIRFDTALQVTSDYLPLRGSSTNDGIRSFDRGYVISGYRTFNNFSSQVSILKMDSTGFPLWQNYSAYAGTTNYGDGLCKTTDGGFAVIGKRTQLGSYEAATLSKFGAQGDILFEKQYKSNSGSVHVGDVEEISSAGDLLIMANQLLPDTVSPAIWLIKTNSQGDSLDSYQIGERYDDAVSLLHTSDGHVIVAATQNGRHYAGINYIRRAIKVWKISPSGAVQWEKNYTYQDNDSSCTGVIAVRAHLTPDGGCIILGGIYGAEADTAGGHLYLLKLDASGNRQWETLLGTQGSDEAVDVLPLSKGGYVVSATTSELLSGSVYAYLALLSSDGTTAAETSVVPSLMEISPNPFEEVLSITLERHFPQGLLELMDVQGRVLLQQNLTGHNSYTFDTRSLSAGVYLLRISDGTSQETRRVVKR